MGFLDTIRNIINPSPAKRVRERDGIKPFTGSKDDAGVFGYSDTGFTAALKSSVHSVKWADIDQLVAYKIDLMTYDEICINIISGSKRFTVTEDTPGWHFFVRKVKEQFSAIDKDWDAKIAYPSFATNLTVIYKKPGAE